MSDLPEPLFSAAAPDLAAFPLSPFGWPPFGGTGPDDPALAASLLLPGTWPGDPSQPFASWTSGLQSPHGRWDAAAADASGSTAPLDAPSDRAAGRDVLTGSLQDPIAGLDLPPWGTAMALPPSGLRRERSDELYVISGGDATLDDLASQLKRSGGARVLQLKPGEGLRELVERLQDYLPYFLVVASSSFVYVALADLIPQLQKQLSARETAAQIAWLAAGIALVTWVSGLAHAH